MSAPLIMQVSDFVALCNQTLDYAYPSVIIEGELSNFRVSRGKWVYFDIKDDMASLRCFGTVYMLPGPLEDGMRVRIVGAPRLHPLYNFSINLTRIEPAGEGSLKKAFELLKAKLEAEGLFATERKRRLPTYPEVIGVVTSTESAAYGDFTKIMAARWPLAKLLVCNVQVQGEAAPSDIAQGIQALNQWAGRCDVLVVTRGGGSAEDLAAFNDERVVRAIAGSRLPTVVAIGHERDISLAELAADARASTPSNAAELVAPDAAGQQRWLQQAASQLRSALGAVATHERTRLQHRREVLLQSVERLLETERHQLRTMRQLLQAYDPAAALQRGYAVVLDANEKYVSSVKSVQAGDVVCVALADGSLMATITTIQNNKETS